MKKKLCSLLLVGALTDISSVAQVTGYHYQAPIDSIKEAGFYNIVLTPAISAHLKTNYYDLRIVNDSGKWVPHLLRMPNSERVVEEVTWELPIKKKESTGGFTEIIVKTKGDKISNLELQFRNTDAERYCTLTGSDDSINWFNINDSILIKPEKSIEDNKANFLFQFPAVNYNFYKLAIHNNGKAPFNIINAGYKALADGPGIVPLHIPVENFSTTIIQKDSSKLSFIKISQKDPYHFDRISLKISGVKYFYRTVDLYIPPSAKHSFSDPGQLLQSFTISNNSTLEFKIPITNAAVFYLIIHNEDNLPLRLDEVKTFNSYFVATAYFEKGSSYTLIMDNGEATEPNYDLKQLNISKLQGPTYLIPGKITSIPQSNTAAPSTDSNKWLIWLMIGIGAVVLGFFTYNLVKEMNKSKA